METHIHPELGDERHKVFTTLGRRLSSARHPLEAARVLSDITRNLFAWDVFLLELYSAETDQVDPILIMDTVDGCLVVFDDQKPSKPSSLERRILEGGPELVLRKPPVTFSDGTRAIGDTSRPSASLMFAQIRDEMGVCGLISVQRYDVDAYGQVDLETLQALAEFCGEALVRIRAQEELRQSEERFRAIFEHAVVGISQTSVEGRFLTANLELARMLGYSSAKELIGAIHSIREQVYVDGDLRAGFLKQIAQDGLVRGFEMEARRSDGSTTWIAVSARAVRDADHQIVYIQSVVEEIAARKRAESELERLRSQLLHIQRLESVGQLAAGVAHDFNNILTIIQGYTSLLQGSDENLDKADCLERIADASRRAANLTRHLLSFSRRQARDLQEVDLIQLLEGLIPVLQRTIPENIAIRVEKETSDAILHADPAMLETVIVNLTTNARDAMPSGGTLLFRCERRMIDGDYARLNREASEGDHICLSVVDSGSGMEVRTMQRVFEPFFTTKDVGKGTGLGLSAAYGIVKQHKGWIEVESVKGCGTTFTVFLPAAGKIALPSEEPPPGMAAALEGTETVLLVEDDASLRSLTSKVLRGGGYSVIEASTGSEALKVWPKYGTEIALLLTDIVMPEGVSGCELALRLKGLSDDLRVVFSTGYNPKANDSYFLFKEGINFIEKPYRAEALLSVVRTALDCEASRNEFRPEAEASGVGSERSPKTGRNAAMG
jgi:two-component system, cell cycle sensor histidine kinase and response regulator CckA